MPDSNQLSEIWRTHSYESSNPFEFCDLLNPPAQPSQQQMYATLLCPEQATQPMPCVVSAHGSMGWRGHHHEYMVRWLEQGIAVLRVHSFDARKVRDVVADQMSVTMAMMLADVFAGLRLLQTIPAIDSARVGIAGWSLGGGVALYSALEPLAEKLAPEGLRFAAHLPIYPAAHIMPEEMRWNSAPIHVLAGAADDYAPAHYAERLAPLMRQAGANIEVTVYPQAHHSYDSVDPLAWIPDAIRLGRKFLNMAPDGHIYLEGSDGTKHRSSTPEERKKMFAASRNVGAHTGVNWSARRASMDAASEFFAATLQS